MIVVTGASKGLGKAICERLLSRGVEVFGVAPDPTAVATLGALLLTGGRVRWELFVVPAIWCAISGATLLAMEAPGALIPPLAAALALFLAAWRGSARRRAVRRT